MSDFKFACPVCGQHITCDAAASGTQMDCPTCFRKLVVPQAPAPGAPNFVLTAAEAQTRPIPLPGSGRTSPPSATSPATGKLPVIAIALGLLVCVAGAGVFVLRGKLFHSPKPEEKSIAQDLVPGGQNPVVTMSLPHSTNWTLDLAAAKIPEAPVSGSIMGRTFTIERAVIQGGKLDLRQGPKWPPDVGVTLHLFAERPQDLADKIVNLETTRTNAPRVILRWKDEQNKPVTKDFHQGYLARVEFGPVTGNHLEGKIYLAMPDDAKSYAAGTFSAEIRKPSPPKK